MNLSHQNTALYLFLRSVLFTLNAGTDIMQCSGGTSSLLGSAHPPLASPVSVPSKSLYRTYKVYVICMQVWMWKKTYLKFPLKCSLVVLRSSNKVQLLKPHLEPTLPNFAVWTSSQTWCGWKIKVCKGDIGNGESGCVRSLDSSTLGLISVNRGMRDYQGVLWPCKIWYKQSLADNERRLWL